MNYLIIGNICSGKTTISRELTRSFESEDSPNVVNSYSIDELRKEHSDGTFAGEFLAWSHFLRHVQEKSSDDFFANIFEFSGTGKNAWFVREAMKISMNSGANWRVIYCSCDSDVLKDRSKEKDYDIPIPYNFGSRDKSIDFMGKQLGERYNTNYWNCPEIVIRTDKNSPENCVKEIISSHN